MVYPLTRPALVRTLAWACLPVAAFFLCGAADLPAALQEPASSQQASPERPYLGAMLCDLTDQEAAAFQPQATEGALVWKLSPDSPAARAGVQVGDVIRMVNAREVKSAGEFIEAFSQLNIGDRMDLGIQRGRELRTVELTLTALATPATPAAPPQQPANQPPLPEGLIFSSAAEPLSYEHPKKLFRLQLPPDWAVHAGHRGRLEDDRFDTLLERSGRYQVIIWRQTFAAADEGRYQDRLFELYSRDGLDYPTVGFGENVTGANWSHLAVTHPETGHQVFHSMIAAGGRALRFDLISLSSSTAAELPAALRGVRDAIKFSPQSVPGSDSPRKPPSPELPRDLLRLKNVLDGQLRSLDLELVSGGTPEAIEMEIESPAGAAVANVRPRTTAAAAGLRRGDLIVQLGNQEVSTPEDVEAVVWTTPVDQLIPLTYLRREQRVTTMLRVAAGDSSRPALGEYRHPSSGYAFRYFPNWRLHPDSRREEVTERVYDYLSSRGLNVKLYLFHDRTAAADPVASLQAYLEETSQSFLEGYSGWLAAGDLPIVFASGIVGREELQTLYRIAFVVDGQRYEINAFTSPLYNPAQLPPVLQAILGSLEQPK